VYNRRAMQPVTVQEQLDYASLGWRFVAVLVDTVVLASIWVVVLMVDMVVLIGQSNLDPNDPAAAQELSRQISEQIIGQQLGSSNLLANVLIFGSLFLYYLILEAIFSASVGKLVCGMRVTMADGSRPTGLAVVVRNVIRVPEAVFFYIPAGISCAVSPQRQRLGDHAARTVVVRRQRTTVASAPRHSAPAVGASVPPAPSAPAPAAPQPGWAGAEPAVATGGTMRVDDALLQLKTAALAARGAHLNYLRFSERELAAGTEDPSRTYSEEYVSAWFTLTETAATLRLARDRAADSATAAGQTLEEASAAQPDLAHLLRELAPYFHAESDESIHEAFLAVARSEASSS
jgi:uncharacterized RDD family membrane protein YckC